MAGLSSTALRFRLGPQRPQLVHNVGLRPLQACRRTSVVSCSNDRDFRQILIQKAAVPAAVILATAMCFAADPNYALAARSGGRVGGSSFSSRR